MNMYSSAGRQEYGFDVRIEPAVHAGHLEFVFEIGDGSEPAQNHSCILLGEKNINNPSKPITETFG